MSIDWERWEAMRASLDYSWRRMGQLADDPEPEVRSEYESLVEHAIETANRLLQFSGPYTPELSTATSRARWHAGRSEAMALRERVVEDAARHAERDVSAG